MNLIKVFFPGNKKVVHYSDLTKQPNMKVNFIIPFDIEILEPNSEKISVKANQIRAFTN